MVHLLIFKIYDKIKNINTSIYPHHARTLLGGNKIKQQKFLLLQNVSHI